eukprot:3382932-Lingulodinium_polyedra.AAC.1
MAWEPERAHLQPHHCPHASPREGHVLGRQVALHPLVLVWHPDLPPMPQPMRHPRGAAAGTAARANTNFA